MRHAVLLLFALMTLPGDGAAESSPSRENPTAVETDHEHGHLHERPAGEAAASMGERHTHLGPHFRWTTARPANPEDQRRAEEIVMSLRKALEPYRDHRKAIADGYEPFLPNVAQAHYHFTSKWRGFTSAFRFNAAKPTSLLYRKTADGYELEGAMYTAPKRADETDLDKRVPLSVGRWHAHVDICLPPKRSAETADWTRFGPKGSIVTEAECKSVKGRWMPQLFGWMIHVYPFKDTTDKIWTH
jgi:hypothetical protein